ncbi:NfeD family protein [Emcibacter nanhaiensis]|nr:nodulation protein NfeD [Emcibacter nanhaiensis]
METRYQFRRIAHFSLTRGRQRWLSALLISLLLLLLKAPVPLYAGQGDVTLLDIKGPIGPAVSDYVVRGMEQAEQEGNPLIILRLDTPGGLDNSMRDIIKAIMTSPVPVACFVAPGGGRAASAGTYILYACHISAMAPGTNLGAATPVQIGGLPTPAQPKGSAGEGAKPAAEHPGLEDKAINDAAAYIRSLAEMRGRNADWAERAVREAVSLSAAKALEMGVIDILATDIPDLLAQMDGRSVKLGTDIVTLKTSGLAVRVAAPDWRTELLSVITNPNVAYILLMVGIYGLIIEFWNPGTILPGVTGAISLLLALYALQLLPVNYAGLALILLGLVLLIAEMFVPAFGVLGLGGLIALVIGSIILIDTDVPGMAISIPIIGSIALVSGLLLLGIMYMAIKAWRRPVTTGPEALVGAPGEVIDWSGGTGHIRIRGEVWKARGPEKLPGHSRVKVTDLEGLRLVVEQVQNSEQKEADHDI